jgi:hypothetical protein
MEIEVNGVQRVTVENAQKQARKKGKVYHGSHSLQSRDKLITSEQRSSLGFLLLGRSSLPQKSYIGPRTGLRAMKAGGDAEERWTADDVPIP